VDGYSEIFKTNLLFAEHKVTAEVFESICQRVNCSVSALQKPSHLPTIKPCSLERTRGAHSSRTHSWPKCWWTESGVPTQAVRLSTVPTTYTQIAAQNASGVNPHW